MQDGINDTTCFTIIPGRRRGIGLEVAIAARNEAPVNDLQEMLRGWSHSSRVIYENVMSGSEVCCTTYPGGKKQQ